MMRHGNCPGDQVQPIVCPPEYRFHDDFTPREVPFIHPIVNVNRHHYVDVPRHYYQETAEDVMGDVMGAQMFPQDVMGAQMFPGDGDYGPHVGGAFDHHHHHHCPGRRRWL